MPLSTVDLSTSSLPKTWFSQLRKGKARKSLKIAAVVHIIIAIFMQQNKTGSMIMFCAALQCYHMH